MLHVVRSYISFIMLYLGAQRQLTRKHLAKELQASLCFSTHSKISPVLIGKEVCN